MSGQSPFLISGGLTGPDPGLGLNMAAAGPGMGAGGAGAGIYGGMHPAARPHFGVVGLVLLAVFLLVIFDRVLGIRFAVTAGRG